MPPRDRVIVDALGLAFLPAFPHRAVLPVEVWDDEPRFLPGMFVIDGGDMWLCLHPNRNSQPSLINPNWLRVLQGAGGGGLPTGLSYVSPCLTIGSDVANQAVVCGSATGNPVTASATGSDTNLALNLAGKGSGGVNVIGPVGGAFGGNGGLPATTSIFAAGTGYVPGDTVKDPFSGTLLATINTVGGGGAVLTYTVTNFGTEADYTPGENDLVMVNTAPQSGVGTGFTLQVDTVTLQAQGIIAMQPNGDGIISNYNGAQHDLRSYGGMPGQLNLVVAGGTPAAPNSNWSNGTPGYLQWWGYYDTPRFGLNYQSLGVISMGDTGAFPRTGSSVTDSHMHMTFAAVDADATSSSKLYGMRLILSEGLMLPVSNPLISMYRVGPPDPGDGVPADYERIRLQWNGTTAELATQAGGTGTQRPLNLVCNGLQINGIPGVATGTFTTADAKTVTVTNGIITSIV